MWPRQQDCWAWKITIMDIVLQRKLHTSVECLKPLTNQKSPAVSLKRPSIQRHKEAVSRYELNSMKVIWSWVGCSICIPSKRLLNSSLSKTGVWPGEAVFHYRCFETEKYLSSGQNFSCVQPHQTVAGTSSRIITFPLNIHLHWFIMKAAFHRDAFRRVDYLLVNPIANKGGDLDQTPRMQKKKNSIYNCTFSAVFICLYEPDV